MSLAGARVLAVGASAGLGREIGVQAAHAGAEVAFAARRRDRLDQAVEDAGGGHAVAMDVTDGASVAAGMAEAVGHLGGLDVLVYASGWASLAPLAEETEDNLRRMFETNVIGAASVVRAALPHLAPATILAFLSSTNTHRRLWGLSGYGASKAAFDRYVTGLRDEHPRLRVVRLRIGSTIGTEFGDGFDGATLTEALARWVVGGVHTARLMAVPDVASVVVGVLSLLRSHPGVDMPEVLLDPPGGLATVPVTPDVVAQAYSALED